MQGQRTPNNTWANDTMSLDYNSICSLRSRFGWVSMKEIYWSWVGVDGTYQSNICFLPSIVSSITIAITPAAISVNIYLTCFSGILVWCPCVLIRINLSGIYILPLILSSRSAISAGRKTCATKFLASSFRAYSIMFLCVCVLHIIN